MSNQTVLRISPETADVDFPERAYATDAYEITVAGTRCRVCYWSSEAWARTPETHRPRGAVQQRDGAYVLIEAI